MITEEHHIVYELDEALEIKRSDIPNHLLVKPEIDVLLNNALSDWLMLVIFCVGAFYLPHLLYPISVLLIASRYHSFGVILHDVVHMPMKKKTIKFRILEILTGYPIGSTINAMRYHHLRHHKDSGMETDPYFKKGVAGNKIIKFLHIFRAVILVPFWTIRGLYGSIAFYIKALRNSYARIFLQDKGKRDLSEDAEVKQCAGEDRWQLLFHLALYSLLLVYPKLFLDFYLFPILISGIFSGYRLLNEHNYLETTDRKPSTIIATTKDNHLSGILKYFLAPKNIGYHIVHHLHPQVAWYKLPDLREWYTVNRGDIYFVAKNSKIVGGGVDESGN